MSRITTTTLRARGALRTPVIVLFALLSGCASDESLRTQFTQLEQRVTGLGHRVEQLSVGSAGNERTASIAAETLRHTQQEQAALSARVDTLTRDADQRAQDVRGLRVQIDATAHHVEQLQTQQKDSGDRLSRVELSAAQAALVVQQAATTAHLTASSAQTALQAIAEQANGALAALATKSATVSQSSSVGPPAAAGPPRAPTNTTPDATPTALHAQQPTPKHEAQTSNSEERTTRPPTVKSTKTQAHIVHTATATPPAPPAETRIASPARALRTIVPRETPANPQGPEETPPANAETAYQLAAEALSQQRYSEAIRRLEDLQRRHPDDPLAVLSLYRLGEAHYAQQAYPLAAQAFQAFLGKQPSGAHVPAILLKLGLIAQTTGNLAEATQRFTTLVKDHPDSQEATIARKILETISEHTR